MYFDQLTETRSLARAKALESFEYFSSHVLGPHVRLSPAQKRTLWQMVLQGEQVSSAPTETFSWLFSELVQRAA